MSHLTSPPSSSSSSSSSSSLFAQQFEQPIYWEHETQSITHQNGPQGQGRNNSQGQSTEYTTNSSVTGNNSDVAVETGRRQLPEHLKDVNGSNSRAKSQGGDTGQEKTKGRKGAEEEGERRGERTVHEKGKGQEQGSKVIRVGFASRYFHSSHDVGIMVQGLLPALQDVNQRTGEIRVGGWVVETKPWGAGIGGVRWNAKILLFLLMIPLILSLSPSTQFNLVLFCNQT